MMDFHSILTTIVLFAFNILLTSADDILGCGGFVKSQSNDIDFSKVEVKLLTKQGSLKDKTDCSPSNGYYFLPVYDKGEYVLQISPPPGWSFEPEQFEINFDGKNDICSQGKDVNFVFKGFGITGKISGISGSVKDVIVELRSSNGADTRKTVSDINGVFYFTPVIPGQYTIKVSRKNWYFEKSEYVVTVVSGNTELPNNAFVVSGFDVSGSILSDGQPLQNVEFVLLNRKNQRQSSKCTNSANLPQITSSNAEYESKPFCSATPSASGKFDFQSIAPGKYSIQPYAQSKNIQFHIQPEYIEFEVTNDAVELKQSFEITGFSVFGRVLSSANGFGVGNAKVILNGRNVATTHTDGSYTLRNIKADTYRITAEADNVQFEERNVKISIANPSIPDIVVSNFKVCGLVLSQQSYTIAITKHASTFHTQATSQKETGEWCTFLPPGKYSIQILTSSEDLASGIQFFPKQQNIEINTSPLSGITFSQLRATVTGDVKCLSSDGEGTAQCLASTISLNPLDADGNRNGQVITASLTNGKYSFSEVLPGTYEVSVPTNLLCWESNTLTLIVKSATEIVPTFVHTGYLVSVSSSHNTKMGYTFRSSAAKSGESASKEILLAPGINSFCVDKFGYYDLTYSGCHTYDSTTPKSFKTGDEKLAVTVNAVKHRNGVRILSDIKSTFKVLVESAENGEKNVITFTEESIKVNGKFAYRHDFDLKPASKLILTPQSDTVLFAPQSKELYGANDCVETGFTFTAAKGLIINGKVTPPIADVKITLTFSDSDETVNAPIEVFTSSNGQFKFGPLNGDLAVSLSAFKESYVFSEFDSERGEFKAHKLCEVIATVKDQDHGNKLSGVLLSLSGAESYRKNLVTGEDGTINFHSLSPSQYYLRPMMKEYRFEPSSKIIDVKDGETVRVELNGKRVAFSVFGSVNSLNGEPFSDVVVEARAEERCGQHQEESTTEPNGQYRIRGLQPGCEYTIRVRSNTENSATVVDRTVPTVRHIIVGKEDINNINIIAISPMNSIDVIARVTASNNDHYKSLRAVMYKKGQSDSPLYSQRVETPIAPIKSRINPGALVFFPRIPFDGKSYVVELTTTLSDKNYKFTLPIEQFQANRSTIYIDLDFSPELRSNENELNENSFSALILLGLVVIAFFKQELAFEFCSFLWTKMNAVAQTAINRQAASSPKKKDNRFDATYNESEIEKLAQSINATKKKNVRKT